MSRLETASSLSTASDVVEEIRLLRQSYLRHGGNDSAILGRLAELENEASAAERKGKASHSQNHSKTDHWPMESNLQFEQKHVISDKKMSSDMNQVKKLDALEEKLRVAEERAAVEKLKRSLNEMHLKKQNPLEVATTLVAKCDELFDRNLPYNSRMGFVIVYDFVTGLHNKTTSMQLSVALYMVSKEIGHYGQPVFLDTVYTVPTGDHLMSQMAFLGTKQPVTQCLPHSATCLIIELMTSTSYSTPVTCAWCRVDLFDQNHHFLSGQWRVPFLKLPIQPEAKTSSLAKFGLSEVCVRLSVSSASSMMSPTLPSTESYATTPKMVDQKVRKTPEQLTSSQKLELPVPVDRDIITFQVIRMKGAEPITCKLRLTAYHRRTGKVMKSSSLAPVSCITTTVDSKYRHSYHVFGQQERSFDGVSLDGDEMLVVRLYMVNDDNDGVKYNVETTGRSSAGAVRCDDCSSLHQMCLSVEEDEKASGGTLIAWAVLPLVASQKKDHRQSSQRVCLNAGTHVIPLFSPPVPDFGWPENRATAERKERYQRATLRLKISCGKPRPGSVTPSEESDDPACPETAWLLFERKSSPSEPFTATDGFDLYIDGCRFLPENVSVTRVSASILDKQYTKVGRAMSCIAKLDSDIHNPVYAFRVEFREPAMPATSTLIIKIYTIDAVSHSSIIVGYALLNIFVETGTVRQPVADAGMQVSLNEGGHQLRIYHQGPEGNEPLSKSCISDKRHVPCATVLIRLVKATRGPQGKPLEADRVPHTDWVKFRLFCPMPSYADCVYYSSGCRPVRGERLLIDAMQQQTRVTVREVLQLSVAQPKDLKKCQTDAELDAFLQKRFNEIMDKSPLDYDLTFISSFNPRHGIKVSLDGARNIPWPNFTEALICCNPPAAFYKDAVHQTVYDKPFFTRMLDLSSTNREPVWNDGFFHLNYRYCQKFLTIIIQLKEIEVKITPVGYKYSLCDEAWAVIQVFNENFVNTSHYQLPLIHGSPSADDLHCLEGEALNNWLSRSIGSSKIQLVPEASVFVRLCDGRRDDELFLSSPDGIKTKLNVEYLPVETKTSYQTNGTGRRLLSMVPDGKKPEEFVDNLANRFKRLVYKLHMDENDEKE